MNIEWDEPKNQLNIKKHGVDFNYAAYVFHDDNRVEYEDVRKDYGEIRYKVVGMVEGEILTLIYTSREHRKRIISARGARRDEKQDYLYNTKAWQQTQIRQN